MIKRIGHRINIILLSIAVLTTGSCDRHGTAWNEMDKAENLMDAKPDSALVVLENIPASSVKGKEAAARYALLKSIALDKTALTRQLSMSFSRPLTIISRMVLLMNSFVHIIIKAGFIRIRAMMIRRCSLS